MTKAKPTPRAQAPRRPPSDPAAEADTESRILQAARDVFTRHGTVGARMQDIAREAGVNQALLHYYFRSKQALADRVFREAAATLHAALPQTLRPDAPLAEIFRAFVHTYIETVRRTPFLPGYLAAEAHHDPARFARLFADVTGKDPRSAAAAMIARVQALIDARVGSGEMRPMRAEHLIVTVVSLLAFPFVARGVLTGARVFDDAAFDRFLDERRDELPRLLLNAVRP